MSFDNTLSIAENDFACTMVPFSSHNFFWVTFAGEVGMSRMGRAFRAFTRHPDFVPGIDELLDFTRASVKKLSRKDFEEIRAFLTRKPEYHHGRSAVVVSSELEYGLGRMMGGLLDRDVPVDRLVTYSLEDALEWLHPGRSDELMAAYAKVSPESLPAAPGSRG